MVDSCEREFEQELLSGYLDGELTQADAQRVRIHLEDCNTCRSLVDGLREIREAAMATDFPVPADDQWDERPRGLMSGLFRGTGWVLLAVYLLVALGLMTVALWTLLTGSDENLLIKVLALSGVLGGLALFVSVLVDRLKTLGNDRYREVEK